MEPPSLRDEFPSLLLRDEFPVLAETAYFNAGTDGPLPSAALRAASAELEREAREGRSQAHFERRGELRSQLRNAYAAVMGCATTDVALTSCTSEGIAQVIEGLRLSAGDEILTSDEEHPGLLGALGAAQALHGVSIRMVALAELADAVGPNTRLLACSHVSWMTGALAPAALAEVVDVPVLLDGAQGLGAVPLDLGALGCAAYAGAGQKWLCGPDGLGVLYTTPELRERLAVSRRGYDNLADPNAGLDAELHGDARRLDCFALNAETLASGLAATTVLAGARLAEGNGWDGVHRRAAALATQLAARLREYGRVVVPRDETTLVSFHSSDPIAERAHLAAHGIVLRDIPGRPWLRASVGAWNDEEDIERLLAALA